MLRWRNLKVARIESSANSMAYSENSPARPTSATRAFVGVYLSPEIFPVFPLFFLLLPRRPHNLSLPLISPPNFVPSRVSNLSPFFLAICRASSPSATSRARRRRWGGAGSLSLVERRRGPLRPPPPLPTPPRRAGLAHVQRRSIRVWIDFLFLKKSVRNPSFAYLDGSFRSKSLFMPVVQLVVELFAARCATSLIDLSVAGDSMIRYLFFFRAQDQHELNQIILVL